MFKLNNIICDVKFERVNEIDDVDNINRARKSKSFLLIINFDKSSGVDCLEINIKLT